MTEEAPKIKEPMPTREEIIEYQKWHVKTFGDRSYHEPRIVRAILYAKYYAAEKAK